MTFLLLPLKEMTYMHLTLQQLYEIQKRIAMAATIVPISPHEERGVLTSDICDFFTCGVNFTSKV